MGLYGDSYLWHNSYHMGNSAQASNRTAGSAVGIVIGALIAFAGVLLAYQMLGNSNDSKWSEADDESRQALRATLGSKDAPITPLWPLLVEGDPERRFGRAVGSAYGSREAQHSTKVRGTLGTFARRKDASSRQARAEEADSLREYFGSKVESKKENREERLPDIDFGGLEDIKQPTAKKTKARKEALLVGSRNEAARAAQDAADQFYGANDSEDERPSADDALADFDDSDLLMEDGTALAQKNENKFSAAAVAEKYFLARAGYEVAGPEETELEVMTRGQVARVLEVVMPPQAYAPEEESSEDFFVTADQQQVDDSVLAPLRRRRVRQPIGFSDRAFHQTVRGWKGTKACMIRVSRARQEDTSMARSLELSMRIRPDGSVDSSETLTPLPGGHALTSCLERSSRQMRFPSFAGRGTVVRKAKFVF